MVHNIQMKILKYDSFVEYNLGLHQIKEKNTKVIYKGPANACTIDIDIRILNTVKWLIITNTTTNRSLRNGKKTNIQT